MCGRLDGYLLSFRSLKTPRDKQLWNATSRYRSADSPLFLLCVIEQIATGQIWSDFISPTLDLQTSFDKYWRLLELNRPPVDIAIPMVKLGKTPLMELRPKIGIEQVPAGGIVTTELFQAAYHGLKISQDLFPLLKMAASRKKLMGAVFETYFNKAFTERFQAMTPAW